MRSFTDVPFAPRRSPFFYGWIVVIFGTLGMLFSISGQTMGVGVFTESLLNVLTLSRLELAKAYLYGTVASGLLLPFAGRLYDRWGARVLVVVSSSLLGMSLYYLSQCDRISDTVEPLTSLKRGAVELGVLSVGFFFVRFFGQGVLTMVSRSMISKWFHRHRGLATGLSGILVTSGFSYSPRILQQLIDALGWRESWHVLGLLTGIGMALIGWIFFRDNPEECGLRMDGAAPESDSHPIDDAPNPASEHEFTLGEALRTYPFWVFTSALALPALIGTAMTFHIQSFGAKAGMNATESVQIFLGMAVCGVVVNVVSGWLSDRIRIKYLLWTQLLGLTSGTLGLLAFGHGLGRLAVIAGMGVNQGVWSILMAVVWPRFYGRLHLGAIVSVTMSALVLASAVGPYLFSVSEEMTGSYDLAIYASVALCILCLALSTGIRNPQRD
ncbi:MAG: MFS transporter [Planctomycetes bacterium]|nr:MFS transporter [Planctomycetota bacterium]